jgi:hypothetical protein
MPVRIDPCEIDWMLGPLVIPRAKSRLSPFEQVWRTKKPYAELGANYFDKLDVARIQQHHIRRLEQLGFTVILTPKEAT